MVYEFATEDEITFAKNKQEPLPWAAGEPGTMVDRSGDILWCNGGLDTTEFKDWAAKNNIPTAMNYTNTNSLKIEGWHIRTFQKYPKIMLYQKDDDFTELFRLLDIVMPELLPTLILLRGKVYTEKDRWIKCLQFSLFEPSLSEHTIYKILYSGDTWMLVTMSYCARVEFEDTNREAFFKKVKDRFGFGG